MAPRTPSTKGITTSPRRRLRGRLRFRSGLITNPSVAVPSFFTLMNLFCGFLAITQVHTGQFTYACYLIVLAGFFDLLDGMMARLTHGHSLFGVELDSLSDIVSFGVAPSYLVFALMFEDAGAFGLIVAALPAMCAAVRLARFNVNFDGEKKVDFEGLPAPAQAWFIVALVLNIEADAWLARAGVLDTATLTPVIIVLALLMVSTIRFDGVPRISVAYVRAHPVASSAYLAAVILFVFFRHAGLLVTLVVYVTIGLIRATARAMKLVFAGLPDENGVQDV